MTAADVFVALTLLVVLAALIAVILSLLMRKRARDPSEVTSELLWQRAQAEIARLTERVEVQERRDSRRDRRQAYLERYVVRSLEGIAQLTGQIRRMGEEPVWLPEPFDPPADDDLGSPLQLALPGQTPTDSMIAAAIVDCYSDPEIDTLASQIDLDMEAVSGSGDTKPQRAIKLVKAARRAGHLDELVATIRKERSNAAL